MRFCKKYSVLKYSRTSRKQPPKIFIKNGDGVRVEIRSMGLNDLVKTAFWFLWFRLRLRRFDDQVKRTLSESQAEAEELNQSQSVGTSLVIGLSFRFCFRLWQSGFTRVGRKYGNFVILLTPTPSRLCLCLLLWCLIFALLRLRLRFRVRFRR